MGWKGPSKTSTTPLHHPSSAPLYSLRYFPSRHSTSISFRRPYPSRTSRNGFPSGNTLPLPQWSRQIRPRWAVQERVCLHRRRSISLDLCLCLFFVKRHLVSVLEFEGLTRCPRIDWLWHLCRWTKKRCRRCCRAGI